ncbi:MAG: glycosyltransferase [Opitutaceae bacterium]|jgi:glycosyltransferase involved in cell wall biosynthesis
MKLCQIVPSLEERHGGPTRSVWATAQALASAGHQVELLTTAAGRSDELVEQGVSVRIFPRARPRALCPSAALRAHLRKSEPEVIHHHSVWLRTLHYAHRSSRARRVPLVISPRGMLSHWAWNHHFWRKRLARVFVHPGALRAADGWHATSDSEAAEIRALGFNQPICVAPNGVAAPVPAETAEALRYWREACPEANGRPVALFYSRFHRKKRVIELIDTWLKHGPRDWLLLLVGIPQEYSVEMLETYVLRASAGGRVRVFDGFGAPPPYAIASLFLLPSHSENFGLVISEALAHGLPAAVTNSTPWEGLNSNGGWCVPWEGYSAALREAVAESAEQLRLRGERARDWVLREYSWERTAAALAGFYARLTDNRP